MLLQFRWPKHQLIHTSNLHCLPGDFIQSKEEHPRPFMQASIQRSSPTNSKLLGGGCTSISTAHRPAIPRTSSTHLLGGVLLYRVRPKEPSPGGSESDSPLSLVPHPGADSPLQSSSSSPATRRPPRNRRASSLGILSGHPLRASSLGILAGLPL